MMLFSVFILACSAISASAQSAQCDDFLESCEDTHDIATITCGVDDDCSIDPAADLDYLIASDVDGEKIKEIDAKLCRIKCEEHAANEDTVDGNKCKFFRWENDHLAKGFHCSLQTTCGGPDATCETGNCVTGQLDCNSDGTQNKPCNLKQAVWHHDKFHVICVNGKNDEHLDINIYKPDEGAAQGVDKIIPDGTICKTVSKCAEWAMVEPSDVYYRLLAVKCDGGSWVKVEGTGSDEKSLAMITTADSIEEPTCCEKGSPAIDGNADAADDIADCNCTHLDDNTSQDWADLICESPLVDKKIEDPNYCMLLCDNHIEKSFSDRFTVDGAKKWIDDTGDEVTDTLCV